MQEALGGVGLRQPIDARLQTHAATLPLHDAPPAMPLLTESAFRALLGDCSPRMFKELRAEGVIGAPLELGPRAPRWTYQDFADAVGRLKRREQRSEPPTLSQARRARIERLKGNHEAATA